MRAFVSNILSLIIGNAFSLIVGFILSLLMIQRLSQADYAMQSAFIAFSGIVMGVSDLGMFSIATRELSSHSIEDQSRLFQGLFSLQLILSTAVCIGASLIAFALHSFPNQQFAIFLLALFSLVLSYAPIIPIEALMAARGRQRQIALFQGIYALLGTVLGAAILLTGGGINPLYIMFAGLSVFTVVLYLHEAVQLVPGGLHLTYQPTMWKVYLRQAIPVGTGSALSQACLRLGTYFMYTFAATAALRDAAVSYLGVSGLITLAAIQIVWIPYSVNILPVMSRLHARSEKDWMWAGSRSVALLLALTLPISIGTMLIASALLPLIGEAQSGAVSVLRVYIWTLPVNVLVGFLYQMFLVQSRQRDYLVATAIGAASSLALCIVLIPRFGGEGAALAATLSLGVIVVISLWMLRRELLPDMRWGDALRLLVALSGMVIAVTLAVNLFVLIRIALGAVVYLGLLVGLRFLTVQDKDTALALLAQPLSHETETNIIQKE